MLTEHWRIADVRDQLEKVICGQAFTPIFQPVVRLRDRQVIGYGGL